MLWDLCLPSSMGLWYKRRSSLWHMIESLEPRIAPAGLSVFSLHGVFYIKAGADDTHDNFTISETSNHTIQVTSTNDNVTRSSPEPVSAIQVLLSNDKPYTLDFHFDSGFTRSLFIAAGNGNHTINFDSGKLAGGAHIITGAGTDTFNLNAPVGGSFVASAGAGQNTLNKNADVGAALSYLASGTNTLNFNSGQVRLNTILNLFGDGPNNVTVNAAATLKSHLLVRAHGGNNTVNLSGIVNAGVAIFASGDGNTITQNVGATCGGAFVAHLGQFSSGSNADTVNLRGTFGGNVSVFGSNGVDTVNLGENLSIGGRASFHLGAGNNA